MGIKEASGSVTVPLLFSDQNFLNCSSTVPGYTMNDYEGTSVLLHSI